MGSVDAPVPGGRRPKPSFRSHDVSLGVVAADKRVAVVTAGIDDDHLETLVEVLAPE